MNTGELTTKDLEFIESLFKVGNSIERLYEMLCNLEINNKKDSLEYQKYLDYLKIALSIENSIYNENELTCGRYNRIVDFIIQSRLSQKMLDDIESIASFKMKNGVSRRIINILNKKNVINYAGKDMSFAETEYEKEYIEDLQDTLYLTNIVRHYLLEDLSSSILFFIEEEINNVENVDVKDDLIKIKYYIAFIFKEVGDNVISNQFTPSEKILDMTKLFSYVMNIYMEQVNEAKRAYLAKLAIKQIYSILNISRDKATILIRRSILRSLLMLMNDEILFDVNDFFSGLINTCSDDANKNNVELIKKCFINAHADKNKQITLKLS